MQAKYVNKL